MPENNGDSPASYDDGAKRVSETVATPRIPDVRALDSLDNDHDFDDNDPGA